MFGVADNLEQAGKTVMFVGRGSTPVGVLAATDALRPGVADMIAGLRKQGIERVVMLTGDNRRVAAAVARQAGIRSEERRVGKEWRARWSPVREEQDDG